MCGKLAQLVRCQAANQDDTDSISGLRVELWATFFHHTVRDGDVKPLV